jgi:hypothetical protein
MRHFDVSIRRAEGTLASSPLWMRFEHGHVKMLLANYVSWLFDDEAPDEYRVCEYLLRGLFHDRLVVSLIER